MRYVWALPLLLAVSWTPADAKPMFDTWPYVTTHVLEGHKNRVRCVRFKPDTYTLATGGLDRSVRIWNGLTGKPIAVHLLPRGG